MDTKIINAENAPAAVGPYCHAVEAGDFVFTSGQIGLDPQTQELKEGVAAQTKQVLANLGAVLKASDLTLDNVIKTTVFLADINDFAEIKPVYHAVMDPASCRWRYYWSDISGGITPDFPPTYFWYGKNDVTLKTLGYPFQGPAVRKALEANGVPCEVHVYENAPHAIGTGNGTDAEGWMTDAVAFWEQHTS